MVRVERLLLYKGDANNVFPSAIAYRSVPRYEYCVSCTVLCGVYRDIPVHRCIVPALALTQYNIHRMLLCPPGALTTETKPSRSPSSASLRRSCVSMHIVHP